MQLAAVSRSRAAPNSSAGAAVHAGEAWHDDVPVYDGDAVAAGVPIVVAALVQSRFTTLVLVPGDDARMRPNGDVLVEVAPA